MAFHNLSSPSPLPSLSASSLPPFLPPSLPPSLSLLLLSLCFHHCLGVTWRGLSSRPPGLLPVVSALLAPVLSVEFVLGLVGNSLAFFICCFHARPWTSNTVFLVSLVVADFLLIISRPLRVDYCFLHEPWGFGATACKVSPFMIATSRSASMPPGRPGDSWGGILLLDGHLLPTTNSSHSCLRYQLGTSPSASLRRHQALFVLESFLPPVLILFAIVKVMLTIRRRGLDVQAGPRRAVCTLAAVVAIYAVCFLPSIIFGKASIVAFRLHACCTLDICSQLFHGSVAFTYLNSALDLRLNPNFLCQGRALLGLTQGWQASASDESTYQPSVWRRVPSGKVVAAGKL
ncbi:hypothetical protein J1605_011093 [Eschrichtius robustus]|uniref:G-protein coupled receptors family 1 profile domain-containing protein n=1 Tax=Eschrichtius robustus TaxID=9764 RepID=A0AB34GNJ9_ESCRO|nr:hypothetical protein J1605_011093 [Eschrichtius robustus]